MMDFDGEAHIQSGRRPCIVVQNNIGNINSPNVIVVPLTTSLKKQSLPAHVVLREGDASLAKASMALCENPVCVSKERLGFYIGTLSNESMKRVAVATVLSTSIISFLSADELLQTWQTSKRLNG